MNCALFLNRASLVFIVIYFKYVPTARADALSGMQHSYFASLGSEVFKLSDSKSFLKNFFKRLTSSPKFCPHKYLHLCVLAESIFTVGDMRLSKDPGFRSTVRQERQGKKKKLFFL